MADKRLLKQMKKTDLHHKKRGTKEECLLMDVENNDQCHFRYDDFRLESPRCYYTYKSHSSDYDDTDTCPANKDPGQPDIHDNDVMASSNPKEPSCDTCEDVCFCCHCDTSSDESSDDDPVRGLGNLTLGAATTTSDESSDLGLPAEPGTYPCNRRKCRTCRYTFRTSSIQLPELAVTISKSFTCKTRSTVYILKCTKEKCGMCYIGETERRLSKRFREHLRGIENKKGLELITKHFSSNDHSVKHLSVTAIEEYGDDDTSRKAAESRLIEESGNIHPGGLNKRK